MRRVVVLQLGQVAVANLSIPYIGIALKNSKQATAPIFELQISHLRRLSRLLRQDDHVDERLCVGGILLQGLVQSGLRLLELALLEEGRGLSVQQQRGGAELVDQLLVDVVRVLDFVTALLNKKNEMKETSLESKLEDSPSAG